MSKDHARPIEKIITIAFFFTIYEMASDQKRFVGFRQAGLTNDLALGMATVK